MFWTSRPPCAGKLEAPLQRAASSGWWRDSGAIVRGVVAHVATDQSWNIVTLDVRETLKGAKAQRLKFAVYKFDKGDAALAQSQQAKGELV